MAPSQQLVGSSRLVDISVKTGHEIMESMKMAWRPNMEITLHALVVGH